MDISYSFPANLCTSCFLWTPFPLLPGKLTWIFQNVSLMSLSPFIYSPTELWLYLNHCTYHIALSSFKQLAETFFFLFLPIPPRNSRRAAHHFPKLSPPLSKANKTLNNWKQQEFKDHNLIGFIKSRRGGKLLNELSRMREKTIYNWVISLFKN